MAEKKLEDKIIKLDPLAKRLDDVGMTGGAGKSKLSKGAKNELKKATKEKLSYSKYVTKAGKRGDFGSPKASKATAKQLKSESKEQALRNDTANLLSLKKVTKETLKNRNDARKFIKRKRIEYKKEADSFQKRGMAEGGLISGKPKLAIKGWK